MSWRVATAAYSARNILRIRFVYVASYHHHIFCSKDYLVRNGDVENLGGLELLSEVGCTLLK